MSLYVANQLIVRRRRCALALVWVRQPQLPEFA